MKTLRFSLGAMALILAAGACSTKTVMPPEPWPFQERAVVFRLEADEQLNLYHGTSHTLLLCIYQLRDPNAFNQAMEDQKGLYKLLSCKRFDPSVLSFKKLVLQPGESREVVMDRAEGAHYVGVAAGYYNLQKEKVCRLFSIPLVEEKKGFKRILKPGVLEVDLYLGKEGIEEKGK